MFGTKSFVLGIGIFIVFMFLLHNGIKAFYPAPEYDKFCDNVNYYGSIAKPLPDGRACNFSRRLQEQEQGCYSQEGQPIYEYNDYGCAVSLKECDLCQKEFNDTKSDYNKIVFIVSIIIGIIVLLAGYAWLSLEPVGSSLMASGIGAIVYGTIVNWENLGNLGRFLLLLLAFLLLIWIAYKLNTRKKKGFWEKIGLKR